MSKGKVLCAPGIGAQVLQAFAFTAATSGGSCSSEADSEGLSSYRRNFHAAFLSNPFGSGGWSSLGSIYLSGDERNSGGKNKKPFPPSGRNGQLSLAIGRASR